MDSLAMRPKSEAIGACQLDRQPEIPSNLLRLEEGIERLGNMLSDLEHRIHPIMHGEHPEKASDAKAGAIGSSEMGGRLCQASAALEARIYRLQSFIARIEL